MDIHVPSVSKKSQHLSESPAAIFVITNDNLEDVDDIYATNLLDNNFKYHISDYFTMDMRLGRQITPRIELSLVSQNLLDKTHMEMVQESFSQPTKVERSFYVKLAYRF